MPEVTLKVFILEKNGGYLMPNVKKTWMNSGKWMQFVDQLLFAIGLINPLYNFMRYLNRDTGNKDKCHIKRNNTPVKIYGRLRRWPANNYHFYTEYLAVLSAHHSYPQF